MIEAIEAHQSSKEDYSLVCRNSFRYLQGLVSIHHPAFQVHNQVEAVIQKEPLQSSLLCPDKEEII